jgi:hypothetical protein
VFFEKGTELAWINLWMHVGGDPEEVEGVIGCRIGAWGIFVRVGVAARVVAGIPVGCLGCGCLGAGSGEIRVEDESAGTTLKGRTSFDITQILYLTLDLILGRLR